MTRVRHILLTILLPLCACQQVPQGQQGQQGLGASPRDAREASLQQAATARAQQHADSLEALFDRKQLQREYDPETFHWVFPAHTHSPACAPAHLAEKSIQVLATADAVQVIELSTYYSGRAVEVWDEDLLDKQVHAQCEALICEKVLETGAISCRWYTDGPHRAPVIGFLSPTDIRPAVADSLLRAWGIVPELWPR